MTRPLLLNLLTLVQNSAENRSRDIMTFAGMCSTAEVAGHFYSQWKGLRDVGRKASILEAARISLQGAAS